MQPRTDGETVTFYSFFFSHRSRVPLRTSVHRRIGGRLFPAHEPIVAARRADHISGHHAKEASTGGNPAGCRSWRNGAGVVVARAARGAARWAAGAAVAIIIICWGVCSGQCKVVCVHWCVSDPVSAVVVLAREPGTPEPARAVAATAATLQATCTGCQGAQGADPLSTLSAPSRQRCHASLGLRLLLHVYFLPLDQAPRLSSYATALQDPRHAQDIRRLDTCVFLYIYFVSCSQCKQLLRRHRHVELLCSLRHWHVSNP